jgi:hypothetical protein
MHLAAEAQRKAEERRKIAEQRAAWSKKMAERKALRKAERERRKAEEARKVKRPVGAPPGANKGNTSAETHGLVTFGNAVKRRTKRGRSLIDRRTAAGQNAFAMREELISDQGGSDNLSVAKLALIEMICRDVYFLDECDRRIFRAIYKVSQQEKVLEKIGRLKNPKLIGVLYGYRQGVARNLASNLLALGLEKVASPAKTLEEILSEDEKDE